MTATAKPKPKKKKLTRKEREWRDQFNAEGRKFRYERRKEQLATTELYQRKIFIESLRRGDTWSNAMKDASIDDILVAHLIYERNSRPVTRRILVDPEKVR